MRRRDFIVGLGGAATAFCDWPVARGQSAERMRRIAILTIGEADPASRAGIAALIRELAKLGWIEGQNLRFEVRFGGSNRDRLRADAAEVVNLDPDAIVGLGPGPVLVLKEHTKTIPIIAVSGDLQENGMVENVARPEGNVTGLALFFGSLGGKWLQLLKEVMPQLKRVAFVYPAEGGTGVYYPSIMQAATILGVQVTQITFHNAVDLVHSVDAFATDPNGGLIIGPTVVNPYHESILMMATQHRLPTIAGIALRGGTLIGYGPVLGTYVSQRLAFYVDRILRGAKPGELPVEFPTRFELVVNLKTAKAIGITIPEIFLARADEVIE